MLDDDALYRNDDRFRRSVSRLYWNSWNVKTVSANGIYEYLERIVALIHERSSIAGMLSLNVSSRSLSRHLLHVIGLLVDRDWLSMRPADRR